MSRTAQPSVDSASAELLAGLGSAPLVDGTPRTAVHLADLLPPPAPQVNLTVPTGGVQQLHRSILIIDDHPDIRDLIAQALSDEGYQVETYSDAEAALGRILSEEPGLVLLDLMMPRMSGW